MAFASVECPSSSVAVTDALYEPSEFGEKVQDVVIRPSMQASFHKMLTGEDGLVVSRSP